MTTIGITLLAIALPAGIILTFLAATRWGHTRRFQIGSVIAFAAVSLWNLGSVIVRLIGGDFGLLFFIELALAIGFGIQARWFWKANPWNEQ